jgi:serine/threonine-protein kinase
VVAERQHIDELARAVADRSRVEWDEELESSKNEAERGLIAQLQNVERIIQAHWGLPGPAAHLGDFEILRQIGRGASGVVYEARQISLERHVAIKVLVAGITADAVQLHRFEREARALAVLNHPNIVTIHSVEHIDHVHFISMELVRGQSLANQIPEGGMPVQRLLDIAISLADALSSAHERRIIHRDLKPANIMIDPEERLKVLDFGLAKLRPQHRTVPASTGSITAGLDMTLEGTLIGTIPYMSPEQAEGRDLDHRSDLFSLGTILYEMATGRRPFQGASASETVNSILRDHPPPVDEVNPGLPGDLERIISHCLRKNPEHRYQTAKGLRNELEELKAKLQGYEIRSRPRLSRPARRPLVLWNLFFVVPALLIVALATPSIVRRVQEQLGSTAPETARYLAILPFAPLGEAPEETNAIAAGLAEILTSKLTKLTDTHDLQVAASGLSRGSPPPSVEEIGESLGVNLAVVGSLQRSGDDVRVTVNLVDVQERLQLRAEVINADLRDPFALQDRIVAAVAEMLELELLPREEALMRTHGTTVADAHGLYLQGRGYLRNYDQTANVDSAIRAFQQALVKDPNYAQAHAGLGVAYWKRFEHDDDPGWVDRATGSCELSVELDDQLAEAHACLGTVFFGTGRHGEAVAEFGWAISLDPTHDEAFRGLARVYDRIGDPEAAEKVYLKAISIRPHYWAGYSWLGGFYFYRGRFGESEAMFRRVTELAPESYLAYSNLGGTYLLQGRFDEAIPVFERSLALKPNADGYSNLATAYFKLRRHADAVRANQKAVGLRADDYGLWGNLGESYYWSPGDRDKAPLAYRRAVELALTQLQVNPKDPDVLGELAKYHAMLGDGEQALGYLERAVHLAPADAELQFGAAVVYNQLGHGDTALDWLEKAFAGGVSPDYFQDAPEFRNLRDEERFQELLDQ